MLIKRPADIKPSEITDKRLYLNRRAFIKTMSTAAVMAGVAGSGLLTANPVQAAVKFNGVRKSVFSINEKPTPYKHITNYNNFYEFGTDKYSPAENAHTLVTRPWTVKMEGEVKRPKVYDIDELIKISPLEERIYRLRCVEGWSMVIPWVGFPLAEVIKRAEPTANAKYIEFVTLYDRKQMPGQDSPVLDWPYVEGLRLDEALHPLTILAVGLYDEVLPNQDGAPLRLVVPWKYGFKSIKSIVRMRFVEKQPVSTWTKAASQEYGFYSNVNPNVDHPRWSQAKERRIGELLKRDTLMFNGYADQVAHFYKNMDLKKYF